jgi:hypothetical protein
VLIEDASRFARDLMTQELGILSLIKLGVRVVTASGDDLTDTSDPMKKAMRQIAGAFAELVTQPSPKDLEGIGAIEALVQKLRRIEQTVYVVNRAEIRGGLTRETVDLLKKRSVFAPITVRGYVDYVREDAAGRAANEMRDEAREDIQKLWERVRSISCGERADGQTAFGLV